MHYLVAEWALLDGGFVRNLRIGIEAGSIVTLDDGTDGEFVAGVLLPGMTDLHSHAFQRTMAGFAEYAVGHDDFWSWRKTMYAHAARMSPSLMHAASAYLGMALLEGGYTALTEFHYLHHDPRGRPYSNRGEMADAVISGAAEAGIALTLLFGVYETSGFGAATVASEQRQFLNRAEDAVAMLAAARPRVHPDLRFGLAPHSLRAVPPDSLSRMTADAHAVDRETPIHIHVAEQTAEVAECIAARGGPPVSWLLDHVPVDRHWCLIHATHSSAEEKHRIAECGAVVGLCPMTEANLGDGIFDLPTLTRARGRFGIGSDSNGCTDAFAELRMLEYSQRLARHQRNIGVGNAGHVGGALWAAAAESGAQAAGRSAGRVACGARADLIIIKPTAEMTFPHVANDPAMWCDAAMFASVGPVVLDAMVGGEWRVRDGRHLRRDAIRRAYCDALARAA